MKKEMLILILCLGVMVLGQDDSGDYPSFDEYVQIYGKVYTVEEYFYRQNIYEQNIATFSSITAYTPGINNYTDWTKE